MKSVVEMPDLHKYLGKKTKASGVQLQQH